MNLENNEPEFSNVERSTEQGNKLIHEFLISRGKDMTPMDNASILLGFPPDSVLPYHRFPNVLFDKVIRELMLMDITLGMVPEKIPGIVGLLEESCIIHLETAHSDSEDRLVDVINTGEGLLYDVWLTVVLTLEKLMHNYPKEE